MTNKNERRTSDYLLLGGVIASAFFIRATGILLLTSFLAIESARVWFHRANRESARMTLSNVLIVCVTFGLLWSVYALLFPGGGILFRSISDFSD
jgi:hypothetical protein